MFCSKCGKEISDSVEYCPFCGTKNILLHDEKAQYNVVSKENIENRTDTGNPFRAINSEITDEDRKDVNYDRYETREKAVAGAWEGFKTLVTTILVLAGIVAVIIWVVIPWFKGKNSSDESNQTQTETVTTTTVSATSDDKTDELVNYFNEYRKPFFEKESAFIDKYNLFQSLEVNAEDQTYYNHLVETKQLAEDLESEAERIQKLLKDDKIKSVNQILIDIATDYCKIMESYDSEYNKWVNNEDPDKILGIDFFDAKFSNNNKVLRNEVDNLYDKYDRDIKSLAKDYGMTITKTDEEKE